MLKWPFSKLTNVTRAQPVSSKRIPELDGIRGLACLLVVTWHYFFATTTPVPNSSFFHIRQYIAFIGISGVDLFFVLSGFLIGGILIDHRDSPIYFRPFYVRRACRILPVYFFITLSMVLFVVNGTPTHFPVYNKWLFKDLMPFWSYATFTQNFFMALNGSFGGYFIAMTWSVAIEEQFYFTFPLFARFATLRVLVIFCLLAPLFSILARLFFKGHFIAQYTLLPCRLDGLALGVLAACIMRASNIVALLRRERHLFLVFILITNIVMFYFYKNIFLKFSLLALFYASLILYTLIHADSFIARVFRIRWLGFVGLISYGLYMYHQPINGLLQGLLFKRIPTLETALDIPIALFSLTTTFTVAYMSYFLVEKRLLSIGRNSIYCSFPASKNNNTSQDKTRKIVNR